MVLLFVCPFTVECLCWCWLTLHWCSPKSTFLYKEWCCKRLRLSNCIKTVDWQHLTSVNVKVNWCNSALLISNTPESIKNNEVLTSEQKTEMLFCLNLAGSRDVLNPYHKIDIILIQYNSFLHCTYFIYISLYSSIFPSYLYFFYFTFIS